MRGEGGAGDQVPPRRCRPTASRWEMAPPQRRGRWSGAVSALEACGHELGAVACEAQRGHAVAVLLELRHEVSSLHVPHQNGGGLRTLHMAGARGRRPSGLTASASGCRPASAAHLARGQVSTAPGERDAGDRPARAKVVDLLRAGAVIRAAPAARQRSAAPACSGPSCTRQPCIRPGMRCYHCSLRPVPRCAAP